MHRLTHFLLVLLVAVPATMVRAADAPDVSRATDPAVLDRLISESRDTFQLIDVRTPLEFRSGHIPTAINIDHREVGSAMADGDRTVPVVVYCRTGNRSGIAAVTLRALGYTVVDFGGINRWPGAIERGDR